MSENTSTKSWQERAERAESILAKAGRALTGRKYVTYIELDEYLASVESDRDGYACSAASWKEGHDSMIAALTAAEARCAALDADKARLDWLEFQLRNMDSTNGGTWLRIGDNGRVQIHRSPSPLHPTEHIWWEGICELDSIPDESCGVRGALDAARKPDAQP